MLLRSRNLYKIRFLHNIHSAHYCLLFASTSFFHQNCFSLCTDIDECVEYALDPVNVERTCNDSMTCENTPGGFNCTCPPGTQVVDGECVEISKHHHILSKTVQNLQIHNKSTQLVFIQIRISITLEPLNKGHIGIRSTVPCREAVLISEVNLHKPDDIFLVVLL